MLTVTAALACAAPSLAVTPSPQATDTVINVQLTEVEVIATRADDSAPLSYTNLNAKQLSRVNHGQDIPLLLSSTPGAVATSDAGSGLGYTSLRLRGTDASRINITINDIPLNDAESHTVYWVNTPDFTSSVGSIQIQRGVGTSTNGSGAFGGGISLATAAPALSPYAEVSGSYGSFNTHKATLKVGTGLLGKHFIIDARLSHLGSDGYRDRASAALQSYYAQLAYHNNGGTLLRFITFGGKEDTYHAWDGISREQLSTERKYNPNGEIKHDGVVTGFYKDQKDIYRQTHYQLLLDQRFSQQWHLNVGLHYTDGFGYYQEYKNNRTLKEYLLQPVETASGTLKKSSLVRKKAVDSDFGGMVFALRYNNERVQATLGGSFNRYVNHHYGQVLWVENYTAPLDTDHRYYSNNGRKNDFNIYAKANYNIVGGLNVYADLQYRSVRYKISGDNDKWDWTASPEHLQRLDINEPFNFFNPKGGLSWSINRHHRIFGSIAVAHKEPTRNNYTDGLFLEHPRSERLIDYELGYRFTTGKFALALGGYYMSYRDQLVLNGRLNEIGEPMAENVPNSYRMGLELTAGWNITSWLRWEANGVVSRNRIKDYVAWVSDYNADTWDDMYTQTAINCGNSPIAFSPSVIANNTFAVDWKGLSAMLQTQYVSRQYLDNTGNKDDSLDPYCVSNLHLNYSFTTIPHVKEIAVGISIYNLFNKRYETNGYSQTAALYPGGDKSATYTLSRDPRFYPMAGTNVLAHLTLRF